MPVIELIHKRVGNDIRILVQLFDNDVPVNWAQVTHIFPSLFSDPQRVVMGKCHIDGIDPQDPTTLMLSYSGKSPQYRGLARLVIELRYMEHTCTVDAPAFVFVDKTADEGVGPVNVEIISHVDPEVNSLQIVVGGGGSASWGTITGDITYQTDLMEALAGKQDTIEDFSAIEAGAAAGATAYQLPASGMPSTDMSEEVQTSLGKADTAVQPGSLKQVAFSGNYNDLTNRPAIPAAQVNSNWNAESGVAQILNKPNLATVATSGSYNDLSNKPSIPAAPGTLDTTNTEGQATSASEALSGTINLHKVSKTGNYSDLRNKPTIPEAPEQSDWTQSDDTKLDYIKHKPNLASVAISGSYDDLRDKPTIPAAQVQSDWNEASSSEKSYIKNKPNLATVATSGSYSDLSNKPSLATVATSGSYNDLSNKPSIPDAQVQSNWTESNSSSKAYIKNKPTLATVATSGSYNDLSNKPTIPTVPTISTDVETDKASTTKTVCPKAVHDVTGSLSDLKTTDKTSLVAAINEAAQSGGGVTQVQSNWTESDDTKVDYIKNKPNLATVATSGSYNDLSNKPSIPAAQVNSDWSAGSGVAQILNKPSLAAVATSGDYDDLTGKPTIPTVPTISTDITTDAASDTKTASPKAVADYVGDPVESVSAPTPYDGTVIFTHLSGDTDTVDLNHVHPQYYSKAAENSQPVGGFAPDVVYVLGELSGSVTFALASAVSGNVNHYFWTFETGASAPTVTWPAGITWLDGSAPTPGASKHCEVSILGGVGVYMEA